MKRWVIAVLFALGACDDDEADPHAGVDAGRDAGIDAGRDAGVDAGGPLQTALASSLAAWNALAAAHPGPYWYESENCAPNFKLGGSSIVQVEGQLPRVAGTRSYPKSECKAQVNRYGTLVRTMPDLHADCGGLLARRSDTRLAFDSEGVVSQCWVGDAPGCKDNCGEGFYLVARGFGIAAVPDASVPADAGN